MRLLTGIWRCAILAACSAAHATVECSDTMTAGADGSLNEWAICINGSLESIVAPGLTRLDLTVLIQGEERRLTFVPTNQERDGQSESFEGRARLQSIEVLRGLVQESSRHLVQEVKIRNLSKSNVRDLSIRFEVGAWPETEEPKAAGLAGYVYDFHKTYGIQSGKNWTSTTEARPLIGFVSMVRHKALILEINFPDTLDAPSSMSPEAGSGLPQASYVDVNFETLGPMANAGFRLDVYALPMATSALRAHGYENLIYSDLWRPLAALSRLLEIIVANLGDGVNSVGFAVILVAAGIRLATLPVTYWAWKEQQKFFAISKQLNPTLEDIRRSYKGAEQSERILAAYKNFGLSPFSGLKGSVGLFIQIPFLLAVFQITTVSSIFENEAFLWIDNLAIADSIAQLPISIPILGTKLNLLPLMLGVVNIVSANSIDSGTDRSTLVVNILSAVIVIIFYSFCSALVLYWLSVNVFQMLERIFFQRVSKDLSWQGADR